MPTLKPNGKRLNGKGSKWITPARRLAIYRRDRWHCRYCLKCLRGARRHARTLDHVRPRADGGSHASSNLVTACLACNVRKQHRKRKPVSLRALLAKLKERRRGV